MGQAHIYDLNLFRAEKLVEDGKHHISVGDLDMAAETFQRSIEIKPTPEALTYLGWVMNLKGNLNEAIELCQRALVLNPDFGNALNDLGSYLIQKNHLEEAIPWLEKAKKDSHYEPRHFPYVNLGRIYSAQGRINEAISEFEAALKIVPGHAEITNVLTQLQNLRSEEVNA